MIMRRLWGLELVAAILVVAVCLAGEALATQWDGGGVDDNWNTADNWDTDIVPTSTDAVLIQGGGINAAVVAPADAFNLRVGDNAVLDVSSTVTLADNLLWGTNPTPGTINVNAGGTITAANLIDANRGTLNINSGGAITAHGPAYLSGGYDQFSEIIISGGSLDVTNGPVFIGSGGPANLEIHGGSLSIPAGDLFLGNNSSGFANGTMDLTDGTVTMSGNFLVGHEGAGLLNMSGGTVSTPNAFLIAFYSTATGTANLLDGTVTAGGLGIGTAGGNGLLNIEHGKLVLAGDATATVDNFVLSGQLVGYGGSGVILRNYDGVNTVVTAAVPEPASMVLLALGGLVALRRRSR